MTVRVQIEGPRADVILDRPEVLNAMNWDVFDGLAEAAHEITSREEVRVVVVSGAGRSFCSGIDTTTLGAGDLPPAELIARAQAGFRGLAAVPVPTIAAVRGHAYGAGMQLALVCDLRVVADDASLGLLETNYGIVPDLGGTHRLPALAGPAVAKQMMWLGERIDGAEAHRRRIAEKVVAPDDLEQEVNELAALLATRPPLAVKEIKSLVDGAEGMSFSQAMDDVGRAQERLMASQDFVEAITAFVQRRAPSYEGR